MKIVEVLNAKPEGGVITITPDAGVRELLAKLAEHNVGALIVSSDGETVEGIVSERDVVRHLHHDGTVVNNTVGAIMTEVVETTRAGQHARRAHGGHDQPPDPARAGGQGRQAGRHRLDRRRGQAQDEPAGVRARPARLLRAPDRAAGEHSHDSAPLVTGGTRGIGAAIAHRLARAGHDLVLGYAQDDAAAELAEADVEAAGGECTLVRTDLLAPDGVDELFAAAGAAHRGRQQRRRDLPHRAAGGDAGRGDPQDHRPQPDLGDPGRARRGARAQHGVRRPGRRLVNISSGAATKGAPGEYVQYAAAKAGVDALTLGLAEEVADQGVRVVGVAPGMIRTTIHADAGEPGRLERVAPLIPMQRAGEPEEVADAVAWLMSDEASYVTGTTLRVAGGR